MLIGIRPPLTLLLLPSSCPAQQLSGSVIISQAMFPTRKKKKPKQIKLSMDNM